MSKDQLFKKIPDDQLLLDVLNLFGIKDLNDTHTFSKNEIKNLDVMNKILTLKDRLAECYVTCKFRQYFNFVEEKNLITLLRQILKTRNMNIVSKEKYLKGTKFLTYNLQSYSKPNDSSLQDGSGNPVTVTFN